MSVKRLELMMAIKWNNSLWKDIENAARSGIEAGTMIVQNEMYRLILETPKTGKTRLSGRGDGSLHQASAPGEPFASDTGNALSRIKNRSMNRGLSKRIYSTLDYQAYLELGTSRMAARPVFVPAVKNKEKEVVDVVVRKIKAVL